MSRKNDLHSSGPSAYANDRWPRQGQKEDANSEGHLEPEVENESGRVLTLVKSNPIPVVVGAFGLGLGFGLGLALLVTRRQPTWFERNVPESFQHLPERLSHVPDRLGSYLPSSWK